jgi:hypothetical protein
MLTCGPPIVNRTVNRSSIIIAPGLLMRDAQGSSMMPNQLYYRGSPMCRTCEVTCQPMYVRDRKRVEEEIVEALEAQSQGCRITRNAVGDHCVAGFVNITKLAQGRGKTKKLSRRLRSGTQQPRASTIYCKKTDPDLGAGGRGRDRGGPALLDLRKRAGLDITTVPVSTMNSLYLYRYTLRL